SAHPNYCRSVYARKTSGTRSVFPDCFASPIQPPLCDPASALWHSVPRAHRVALRAGSREAENLGSNSKPMGRPAQVEFNPVFLSRNNITWLALVIDRDKNLFR